MKPSISDVATPPYNCRGAHCIPPLQGRPPCMQGNSIRRNAVPSNYKNGSDSCDALPISPVEAQDLCCCNCFGHSCCCLCHGCHHHCPPHRYGHCCSLLELLPLCCCPCPPCCHMLSLPLLPPLPLLPLLCCPPRCCCRPCHFCRPCPPHFCPR